MKRNQIGFQVQIRNSMCGLKKLKNSLESPKEKISELKDKLKTLPRMMHREPRENKREGGRYWELWRLA